MLPTSALFAIEISNNSTLHALLRCYLRRHFLRYLFDIFARRIIYARSSGSGGEIDNPQHELIYLNALHCIGLYRGQALINCSNPAHHIELKRRRPKKLSECQPVGFSSWHSPSGFRQKSMGNAMWPIVPSPHRPSPAWRSVAESGRYQFHS